MSLADDLRNMKDTSKEEEIARILHYTKRAVIELEKRLLLSQKHNPHRRCVSGYLAYDHEGDFVIVPNDFDFGTRFFRLDSEEAKRLFLPELENGIKKWGLSNYKIEPVTHTFKKKISFFRRERYLCDVIFVKLEW